MKLILGTSIAVLAVLLVLLLGSLLFLRNLQRKTSDQKANDPGVYTSVIFMFKSCRAFCNPLIFLCTTGNALHTSTKPSTSYSIARGWHLTDEGVSYYIPLSELEEATKNFSKKIGKGSFGTVYYGQMKDGKEVAVKIMADSSSHVARQFVTEVLSYSDT